VRSVTLRQEELRDFARAERHKRLSKGRFRLPATTAGADRVTIDKTELAMILGGFDPSSAKRQAAWSPKRVA
jgi:hypothetical protein